VPPGSHWIQVGKSWKDGPVADTCEGISAKQRAIIGTEARVELTLAPDPKVCKAAKTALTAKRKAVNKLKAQLRNASSTKAKNRLRTKLTAAKAKQAKAVTRVGQVC
jgi:hypothetical protein